MSEFTPISKDRTKELEEITSPYIMKLSQCSTIMERLLGSDPYNGSYILKIHSWHSKDASLTRKGLYEKVKIISSKLGMKQTYYVQHTMRNAVWGIEYKGNEFLLYYSTEGLAFQITNEMSCGELLEIIDVLVEKWQA